MESADPSELLHHANWLRQLARSLVDEGADDLVQETWVAALRRPPRSGTSARPWLRAVLTNAARLRWRGDANRAARERATAALADRDVPSSAELLERHELQQLLARLVGDLDEPFRSTILLRFAEGLTPTQIARRLGVPAGTVRWRLKEALERLRVGLDAAHRGDRRAWVLALAPLALPRPAAAASVAPLLALVLVAAAAVAIVLFARSTASDAASGRPAAALRDSAGSARPPPPASTAPGAWLAQEGARARPLRGRVVAINGGAAAGARVRLVASPFPAIDLITDPQGRFDFGEQPPREYALGASLPGTLAAIQHVDLRAPSSPGEVELVLGTCAASLYGRITDASGTPIRDAQILREGVIGAETDATGAYELCTLPTAALVAELRLIVRAAGFGTLAIALAPPGRMRRDFVLAPEASITGRVIGADGAPLPGARVAVSLTAPVTPPERGYSLATLTDDEGAFRIAGLDAGEFTVSAATASALAAPQKVVLEAAQTRTLDLRVSATGVLRGRVVSGGRPVAGASVSAGEEAAISQGDGSFVLARVPVGDVELTTAPYRRISGRVHILDGDRNTAEIDVVPLGTIRGTVRRHGVPVPFARVDIAGPTAAGLTTDASGHYEARGLEPGSYGFYCDDRQRGAMFAADRTFALALGETRERDIELAWGGTISGVVVDGRGAPVAGALVWFRAADSSHCVTDESGAYACSGFHRGTYAPAVFPASGETNAFRFLELPPPVELRDDDARVDGVRLVVEPTLRSIDGKVVDGAGDPVPDVVVRAVGADRTRRWDFQASAGTVADDDGSFRIGNLSPGEYFLEVERAGLGRQQRVTAGDRGVTVVLDQPPCAGAGGHDVPSSLTRPPAPVIWDDSIELVGWSVRAAARTDASVEVVVVYRALRRVDRNWTLFSHFDSATLRVNGDHEPAMGWCPTSRWQPGETIVDRATVRFDRPGHYTVRIGLFTGRAPNWENLRISAAPPAMLDAKLAGVHIADLVVTE